MPPKADFTCLSGKCDKAGRLVTYELPIKATRCPVCGSKKIKRLYNKINIATGARPDSFDGKLTSSSHAARTDAFAGPAMQEVQAKRDMLHESLRPRPLAPFQPSMVPIRNLGQVVNVAQGQADLGRKADIGGQHNPVLGEHMVGRSLQGDTTIRAKDTEFKVVKGADGPEIAKA